MRGWHFACFAAFLFSGCLTSLIQRHLQQPGRGLSGKRYLAPYMKKPLFSIAIALAAVAGPALYGLPAAAQTTPETPEVPQAAAPPAAPEKDALKYNLNESGTHYFQATFLNQTWLRINQSNPGTTVNGLPQDQTFDIGLRRTRIQLFGQLNDRAFLYLQFGQNNFNAQYNSTGNRKISPFFHDAVGEYRVSKGNQLKLGAGLTIANGLSRFSQPSIGTILTLDVPVFAQATVDQTDQFSRKLSVFARGQISRLDYRLVLSDPFPITSNGSAPPPIGPNATFAQLGHHKQYQAYLAWNFLEMEGHATPYMAGTYLGKKKVFNVAAGAIYQQSAMWHKNEAADTVYQAMLLLSAETFLDLPLNRESGTALSAYAGYFQLDFGKNYLRFNGIMNPATGTGAANALSGAGPTWGNAVPMFGSGNVQYAQLGYLLPAGLLGEGHGQLQPWASYTRSSFDRLGKDNTADLVDVGANWLLNGHRTKLSIDFQNRPTYKQAPDGSISTGPRKSAVILQYQLFI